MVVVVLRTRADSFVSSTAVGTTVPELYWLVEALLAYAEEDDAADDMAAADDEYPEERPEIAPIRPLTGSQTTRRHS